MSEVLSATIFILFVSLLVIAAASTVARYLAYRSLGIPPPRLLPRDRDVFIGLALPFLLIAAARFFRWDVLNEQDRPEVWWLLLTGIPALYAVARYVYFEIFVIER